MIKLVQDTINKNDIDDLIKWLHSYPRLTKGEQTIEFEKQFAEWVGTKYSVFVNSGSSANLLMLYALKEANRIKSKDKILIPNLSWATDLAPIIQLDLEPILVDCNLDNLSIDVSKLESIIITFKPKVLLLVSVLGLSPNIDLIVELCNKYNVILLEDNCESQGTEYKGKKLGNFGLMSSFSTYFGHTMSTIEGGLITTNDTDVYEFLKMLRSHGWDRDVSEESQQLLRKHFDISDFNALYTFYTPGFNLRSTDLQAFLGINQLKKVDEAIKQRNKNFQLFKKLLENKTWFPKEQPNSFTASFCIPVIFKNSENKKNAIKEFQENNIEIRPLIAGSMGKQPMYIKYYEKFRSHNSDIVDSCGMYVPNHPLLTEDEIKQICEIIIKNDK